jgi:hypothetical protein
VNYYREDIQPTTVMGQQMKRWVENGDHCDGNIYWLIEVAEAQRVVIENAIQRFNEVADTASKRFDEIRRLEAEIDLLKINTIPKEFDTGELLTRIAELEEENNALTNQST